MPVVRKIQIRSLRGAKASSVGRAKPLTQHTRTLVQAHHLLDDGVVSQRDAILVDLHGRRRFSCCKFCSQVNTQWTPSCNGILIVQSREEYGRITSPQMPEMVWKTDCCHAERTTARGNAHLGIAPLVDQLLDRLQVRISPSHVWLHQSQHVHCGLVDLKAVHVSATSREFVPGKNRAPVYEDQVRHIKATPRSICQGSDKHISVADQVQQA